LRQLRVEDVRRVKLAAEIVDISGKHRKENVHHWKPLPSNVQ
jgi:hypothetical protein